MRLSSTADRLRGAIAFWALAGVALLASHDAVFLVQMGPGEALARALRSAGHGYWGAASLALILGGLTVAAVVGVRLLTLRRRARRLSAVGPRDGTFGRRLLGTWGRLLAVVAVAFVVQENVEHLATHSHAVGVGALTGPEYPLAIPVIAAITLAAALLLAFVARTERTLLATIAAAGRQLMRRAPRRARRAPQRVLAPRPSPIAGTSACRAPPLVGFAPI